MRYIIGVIVLACLISSRGSVGQRIGEAIEAAEQQAENADAEKHNARLIAIIESRAEQNERR